MARINVTWPGGAQVAAHRTLPTCKQSKATEPNTLAVSMLVPALPTEFAIRGAIRDTWFSDATHLRHRTTFCESPGAIPHRDERPVCIDARFIVGMEQQRGGNTAVWDRLADEIETHGDIVVLPILERGSNLLSSKSAAMLNWAVTHRAYADYVIKLDTDAYVYVPRFIQHLPMPRMQELILVGRRHPTKFFRDYGGGGGGLVLRCTGGELYAYNYL